LVFLGIRVNFEVNSPLHTLFVKAKRNACIKFMPISKFFYFFFELKNWMN
jgi:hypothetical protein